MRIASSVPGAPGLGSEVVSGVSKAGRFLSAVHGNDLPPDLSATCQATRLGGRGSGDLRAWLRPAGL